MIRPHPFNPYLLRLLALGLLSRQERFVAVKEIMKCNLVTATPETPTVEALKMMRNHQIGCLPVVEEGRLVGIVTAYDFLSLSTEILEKQLSDL